MKIQVLGFAGEMPRTIPRLLGESYAQSAVNTKLEDGSLTPVRRPRLEKTLSADAQTIYKFRDEWLSWPGSVNVAPAPVATDRIYVTGDGRPKLIAGDETYDLALDRPTLPIKTSINVDTEFVTIDGTTFKPTDNLSGKTTKGYSYTVVEANRTATITVTQIGMSVADAEALVNSIGYSNTTTERTAGIRTVTLTKIVDSGADNNEGVLNIRSKVFVDTDNDAEEAEVPELEVNEDDEFVTIDGKSFKLVDGLTVVTNSGFVVTIDMNFGTAQIKVSSAAGVSVAAAQNMVNSIGYSNLSANLSPGIRLFTINELTDSGSNVNTGYTAIASRVYVDVDNPSQPTSPTPLTPTDTPGLNDPPQITTGSRNPTYAFGDGVVTMFQGTEISTVDAGQTIKSLTFTVTGFKEDGSNDIPVLVTKPLNPTYTTGIVSLFSNTKISTVDIGQTITSVTFEVGSLVNGNVSADLSQTILYAYTWVTKFDEESEPSDLSAELLWDQGLTVTLTGFSSPPTTRGVDRMRIYRSQTSSLGVTELFFIAERPATTAPFVDESLDINEPIPSTNFNPPPDGLSGIISLPNGMMAAFDGKRLYFCEPFIPHAWPESYVLTTDFPIVGLGSFGGSMAILTTGLPYVVSGNAPENMVMEKIETNYPCINARGIVDLGYAIAYPSHGGLVAVSSAGAKIVSDSLFTRDQWLELAPQSFVAGQFSGRYLASYSYFDIDNIKRRGIIIMDLSGAQPFLIRSADYADAMFYEVESGSLYFVAGHRRIYLWDAQSQPYSEQTWMSKRYMLSTDTNFGAILIEGDDITSVAQKATINARNAEIRARNRQLIASAKSVGGEIGQSALGLLPIGGTMLDSVESDLPAIGVSIIADGREVGYVSRMNEICRLPSGFQARSWEIVVRGNVQVTGITLANTPNEIAEG